MIFVTEAERNEYHKTENLTIKEIEKKINSMLCEFPDDQQLLLTDIFAKTVKNKPKRLYVSFYDDVKQKLKHLFDDE